MKRVLMSLALVLFASIASLAEDAPQSRVSITSQPSGATIIIDGRDRGVTPITLFDLKPGRHHCKFRLAGYVERDRFIDTKGAPFVEKNEVMVEEKGLLLLKTDPEGCSITIDGVACGQTPRLITHLAAKDSYSVKFTKPGYLDQIITVKFDGRTPLVREEKMVLDSGVINVITDPAGAEITVNGIERGVSPVLVRGIPKGRASVKCRRDGYKDEVRELEMRAGDQQTLSLALEALPGTLHLTSIPPNARFYIDDQTYGKSPVVVPGLKPGEYQVRAELEGYGTLQKTITIGNGESAREEFRLSNVVGRLEVRTDPAGATIFFDGRQLGMTKGQDDAVSEVFVIDNILEGEHTLLVRKDGYLETTRHPKIVNSKTTTANVRLRRVFTPDVEILTDRGVYRGVLQSRGPEGVVVEVRMGITQTFSNSEIRKINYPLEPEK